MKATELIKRLQELVEEYGDHECVYMDDIPVYKVEYDHDESCELIDAYLIQ